MCVPILGAYFLDNEFIKDEHSPKVSMSSRLVSLTLTPTKDKAEFRKVLRIIASTPHCPFTYGDMISQWSNFELALVCGSHGLDDDEAFSKQGALSSCRCMSSRVVSCRVVTSHLVSCRVVRVVWCRVVAPRLANPHPTQGCAMAPFVWAKTFMYPWEALMWVALRVTSLTCSASGCEHAWSIEGWVHSNKRNRLGQKNVERLVRAHTNMRLDRSLNSFVATSLPWEMEMIVDEPDEVVLSVPSGLEVIEL